MNIPLSRPALQISLIYALVAGAWIFFSDRLLTIFTLSPNQLVILGTYKGLAFVVITSLVLYLILNRELHRRDQAEAALQESQRAISTLISNLPGMVYRSHNDRDWTIEFVSEGCFELTGYKPVELLHNQRVAYGQLIQEDDRDALWDRVQSTLQQNERYQLTYRITTAAGEEKWVWEQGSGVYSPKGELVALEGFITDFTEPAMAQRRLEQQVEERTRELSSLLAVQNAITSHLDPEAVLQLIADEVRYLTGTRLGLVYLVDGDDLRIAAISGEHSADISRGYRMPLAQSVAGATIGSGHSVLIPDTRNDSRVYTDVTERLGVRCYLSVPLLSESQPIGVIAVANRRPASLQPEDERILTMLAPSAVVAIENARLYHLEQERRRVAEGLRDMLAILNSDRSIDEIFDHIMSQARRLLQAQASAVSRVQEDEETLVVLASQGFSEKFFSLTNRPAIVGRAMVQMMLKRQPIIRPNLATMAEEDDPDVRARGQDLLAEGFQALLAMPLIVRDEIYGALIVFFVEPREFSADDIALATSFCDQAALAIENARLKAHVEEAAVAAERQRLARDLHDAVTQTLFSASLIAEMLPRVWDRHPEEAQNSLEELRQLTRGALAEMRTLLLELRPSALTEAKFGALLRQLTEAMAGRTRIPVSLAVEGDRSLPPDVQIALYRITQEALNNITKHAEANQVAVNLRCQPEWVELGISDDGRGFDPGAIPPDHLGVGIMHERARKIGATLNIESRPGQGTQVLVTWQNRAGSKENE